MEADAVEDAEESQPVSVLEVPNKDNLQNDETTNEALKQLLKMSKISSQKE